MRRLNDHLALVRWMLAGSVGCFAVAGMSGGCTVLPARSRDLDAPHRIDDGRAVDPFVGAAGSLGAVVFLSHECPIANAMAPDLIALAAHAKARGVDFYAVHVGGWTDGPTLRAHAAEYGLRDAMTVLVDRDLRTVRALGATITPEGAVFRRDGAGGFERLYLGRVNDLYAAIGRRRARPIMHDLADAIDAAASGKTIASPMHPAVGCFIDLVPADPLRGR